MYLHCFKLENAASEMYEMLEVDFGDSAMGRTEI
jgi:hypothetical protein